MSLNINKFRKSISTSEFEKNASIQNKYFKYSSNLECKFASLESLLHVHFWPRKEIQMHFKSRFKVYLKYTSLLNSWWTQSILETYKSKLFFNYFHNVPNFASQNISKSILEVYFIFRVQKYIWSIAQFQQDKILIKVYIIYGGNGLVVSVQVYQTKDPRFKTIRWLKNCLSFHPSKVNLMNIKDS